MLVKQVDVATARQWLQTGSAVLIDVREPAEYASENIPEATLLPLSIISRENLPDVENKKIVIHCRSGQRSLQACKKLLQEDAELDVYNLEGGILAWNNLAS